MRRLALLVSALLFGCGEEESSRGQVSWLIGTWVVANPEEVAAAQARLIVKARSASSVGLSDGMSGLEELLFPGGSSYEEADVFKMCLETLRSQALEFSTGGRVLKTDAVDPMSGTWTVGSEGVDLRFAPENTSADKGVPILEFHMHLVRRGVALVWVPPITGDTGLEVEFVRE